MIRVLLEYLTKILLNLPAYLLLSFGFHFLLRIMDAEADGIVSDNILAVSVIFLY